MAYVRIFLTTPGAGTWTVPEDCTSATIECIGGGGGWGANGQQTGAGGGGYSKLNSISLTPGASIPYSVGARSVYNTPGYDSWFSSTTTVLAKGGGTSLWQGNALGGQASAGYGDIKYSGGNGGNGGNGYGGGGGAAGMYGNGNNGGGNNGGSADAGFGGAGGSSYNKPGENGTEWDATHGSGGGGGSNGASGGNYGGGGGNGGATAGAQGIIVITYTPAVSGSSSFFQLF